ncbi:MAG: hypothetical protein NTY61_01915, partial [Candidatus Parcubacteria bacterium]|nr:hypothetical protein [Candidatus Parcubacteria bacterium]
LTPEEIKRHPEIAESAKKTFLYRLKQMANNAGSPITTDYVNEKRPYLNHDLQEIQDLVALLKSQPEKIGAMVNQPEVSALQNKIFQRCLCDTHDQQYAPLLRDSLLMSKEQAQKIVINTLASTVTAEDRRYGMNINHVAEACSDFNLDRATRFDLALKTVQRRLVYSEYPRYLTTSDLRKDFNLTEQDLEDFINQHRLDLEKYGHIAILKDWATGGGSGSLAQHLEQEFHLRPINVQDVNPATFTPEEQKLISQEIFHVDNQFPYLLRIIKLTTTGSRLPYIFTATLIHRYEKFSVKDDEQIKMYVNLIQKITDSPSQEMIRVKDQLIEQILITEDPEKTYDIIQNIFIQNNIPLVGKIQRIFDALFPDKALTEHLQNNSSPVLLCASPRLRRHVIFQDLLKVHIESGNRSLKMFLQLFRQAEPIIAKLDSQGGLSPTEQQRLTYVFKKLKTLIDASQRGQLANFEPVDLSSLKQAHQELRQQLGAKPDQSISERVVEMFAKLSRVT